MHNKAKIREFQKTLKDEQIINEIDAYLIRTEYKYNFPQPEYGGRTALIQAKASFLSGNYGVGAAVFVVKSSFTEVYFGRNKIVTGKPSERFNCHAETDAIKAWLNSVEGNGKPDFTIKVESANPGLWIYSNLEPCPKCEVEITLILNLAKEYIHPKANIACVCLSADGELKTVGKIDCSSGGAHALGRKHFTSPLVWQSIQRGYFPGQKPTNSQPVQFSLLSDTSASLNGFFPPGSYILTIDRKLVRLSWAVFANSRDKIDRFLISGKI